MYLVRGGLRGPGDAAPSDKGGRRPATGLLLTEPIRGLADLTALLLAAPALLAAPRGDGHGVLVFPGLLAGDASTVPLRAFLRWLGYDVRGWDLGRNQRSDRGGAGRPAPGRSRPCRTDRASRIPDRLEPGRHLRQGDGPPPPPQGPSGHHAGQPLRPARPAADLRPRSLPAVSAGTPPTPSCPAASSGPGPSACRPRRSTPAGTAWCPGRRARSRRRRCTRTSRSGAATSASAWTRRRSG